MDTGGGGGCCGFLKLGDGRCAMAYLRFEFDDEFTGQTKNGSHE